MEKLSAVLEQAISTGVYQRHCYMCYALQDMLTKKKAHPYVKQVQYLVTSIHSTCISLIGALGMSKAPCVHLDDEGVYDSAGGLELQFYIWWIFDLKRAGL